MQEIYLARQPIVDRNESLVAFELLFRSANTTVAGVVDDTHATAQVMVNAFNEMGISEVLGTNKGFINVDAVVLHGDLIEMLPKQQIVIELLESITIDAKIIERCRELKAKGFSIALDDVEEVNDANKPLLGIVDIIKLDLMAIAPKDLCSIVNELKRYPVKLLAEKVEYREQAKICVDLGFDLFQGYYFSRPQMLTGKRTNPSKMVLLRIFSMMISGAENQDIADAFKEHADLSYCLMRLVNSPGVGFATKISSLKQGLMVLGREQLKRWVQLLLYASDNGSYKASPLMQLAASRGKFMELIAHRESGGDRDYSDRAFMVGMLSLLDVLLGESLDVILARLNLNEEVQLALTHYVGKLGSLLSHCKMLESVDINAVHETLILHPTLTIEELNRAQLEAMGWANNIAI